MLLGQIDDPEVASQIEGELCDAEMSKEALISGLAAPHSELGEDIVVEDVLILVDRIVEEEVQRRLLANERYPSSLNLLGLLKQSCLKDFGDLGSASEIKELIMLRVLHVALTEGIDEVKIDFLAVLAVYWSRRFKELGDPADIEKAIEAEKIAAQLTPDDHPDRLVRLSSLGILFHRRFERLGELGDVEKSIECQSLAVQLTPDGHPDKPAFLNNLGNSWFRRFERLGELADLVKSIECQSLAVQLTPDGHPDKPAFLNNLGNSWLTQFERLGELADLEKSIKCKSLAVKLTPDGHPDKPAFLNNLGNSWLTRFERLGELADLQKSIECQSLAVQLTPDGHPGKPSRLNNLGNSWLSRFKRLGELADLEKSIECQSLAVQLTPDGHPDKPAFLNNLGNSWFRRFERLGELAYLEKSIECQSLAVQLTPESHPDKPGCLNSLGNSWSRRFERLGELAYLEKSIECQSLAVQLTPDGHPDKPSRLNNLGNSWFRRFERLGELADLEKSIECQSLAVQLTPDGHPDKPAFLNNLGNSWFRRFERLGELADLVKSIECQSLAVQLTPDGHPDKPAFLNNLGNSWFRRFERLGELADLEKSMEYQSLAVQLTPDGHPDKPSRLNNLGSSWSRRFERLGEPADLEKSIECQSLAVQLTPDGHPDKPSRLNNLGYSWSCRFERLGALADLEKSIECQLLAVQLSPEGHANRPHHLERLGGLWMHRFRRSGLLLDLGHAIMCFKSGAEHSITNPGTQIKCARNWGICLTHVGLSPLSAFNRAFSLLPRLAWLGLTLQTRYNTLIEVSSLATGAAAWAAGAGQYDLAIEWLEQGRSVVWSQVLQLRTPFEDLSVVHPNLASRLKETATELEAAGSRNGAAESSQNPQQDLESQAVRHCNLAAEWDELLVEVRQIPGFHDYLLPRKSQELKKVAQDGPVVILNAHETRCDALIILPQQEDVLHVPLPQGLWEKASKIRAGISSMTGYRGTEDETRAHFTRQPAVSSNNQLQHFVDLWSDIVRPILDAIECKGNLQHSKLPHVTWCATGVFSFLPLHAAGLYDGSLHNAFDLIVSSYTPTLAALLPPKTTLVPSPAGVLAVGQANTPSQNPLHYTENELAIVEKYTQAVGYHQLNAADATVDATLAAMEQHSWVHLACHATQDRIYPSHSAFMLHDGPLTLEEIAKRAFRNKGLAFLSACQTATGDDVLPDEATHLAAGMLMAGYRSVIATMWSIKDVDAPEIAEEVYKELLTDGKMDHTNAARALHGAVAKLREKVGMKSIGRWAPYIHIGA